MKYRSQAVQKGKVHERQLADPAGSETEPTLPWIPTVTIESPTSAQSSQIQECRMMMDGEVHCPNAPASFEMGIPTTTPAASSSPATGLLGDPLNTAGQVPYSHTTSAWTSNYPVATPTHECHIDIDGPKHCSSPSPSENDEIPGYPTSTHRPHKPKPRYKASKCLKTLDGTEQCWHLTFDDQFVVCNRSMDQEPQSCEPYVGRVVENSDYNGQKQEKPINMHGSRKRSEMPAEKLQVQDDIEKVPIFFDDSSRSRESKQQHGADLDTHHPRAKPFKIYQREGHRHGLPKSVIGDIVPALQLHLSPPPPSPRSISSPLPPHPPPHPQTKGSCHPILHHRAHCTFPLLPPPSNPQTTTTPNTSITTCAIHHNRRICYNKCEKHARSTTVIEARRHGNCYEIDDGRRAECTFEGEVFR